jgi:hypothetical protein
LINGRRAQGNVHAYQELVDGHFTVAVAITDAGKRRLCATPAAYAQQGRDSDR